MSDYDDRLIRDLACERDALIVSLNILLRGIRNALGCEKGQEDWRSDLGKAVSRAEGALRVWDINLGRMD